MVKVIDSCLWIDFLGAKTTDPVRQLTDRWLNDAEAALCELVQFEVLRGCDARLRGGVQRRMETMPYLPTPGDLWNSGLKLGEACYDRRVIISSVDLLIAALCIHHGATLVTFDNHFQTIAELADLKVEFLTRPV
jgi:predicted nucleic acid-binding protein